jgi:hypothetical protein
LSRDPATADYPAGRSKTREGTVSPLWFSLGFPLGFVADVLQNLEVLASLGHARDQRLNTAIDLILSRQDDQGRWINDHPHRGQTWTPFDKPGAPSKWVTLRACTVLRARLG